MRYSQFGQRFSQQAGILGLMQDLGDALASGGEQMVMMGGGNPGAVPAVEAVLQRELQAVQSDPVRFRQLTGIYDPPAGAADFRQALAELLSREYGWPLSAKNIALTNGSQGAFFTLFNLFAGQMPDGSKRRILLPLAPEYIGYVDLGLSDDFFVAYKPEIEQLGEHRFKYHVDFDRLEIDDSIGALCVSRPTNPTGNVLTDDELARLDSLARARDIPLIIDGAYGLPFPELIFTEATPHWNSNTILCLSLSKLGLPAARTGIVVASEEIIERISAANAILQLAPNSLGSSLVTPLIRSGEILTLSREQIKPWYLSRQQQAVAELDSQLAGLPYALHQPEGALFLWLWLKDLPISSEELYQRLKKRGVLVVSGHHFFPGIEDSQWPHQHECLRITYSQQPEQVRRGVQVLAEEVRSLYG